jgi:glutamin-(asparagin-)ase
VNALVDAGAKAIVHAGTGNGSVADRMVKPLQDARAKGVHHRALVTRALRLCAAQCRAARRQVRLGGRPRHAPRKARMLTMLALTKGANTKELQRMFWEY